MRAISVSMRMSDKFKSLCVKALGGGCLYVLDGLAQ